MENICLFKAFCRHQDRSEVGNALRPQHHEEDVALMLEMGVNAVRFGAFIRRLLIFYDLMDKNGIIVWAEIPFVVLVDIMIKVLWIYLLSVPTEKSSSKN